MTSTPSETTPSERRPSPPVTRRALLIGIRSYPSIPGEYGQPLAGCHNDVARLREVLLALDFREADLTVLVDTLEECDCPFCREPTPRNAPTREGILAAVRKLCESTGPDDVVLIYYSGHGSEFLGRGLDAGQRFQTIVPHDSGRGQAENRDITDREIAGWIRDLNARTPYLTLVFDCCHSGGVTDLRGGAPDPRGGAPAGRRVKADDRGAPTAFSPEPRAALASGKKKTAPRRAGGWLRGPGRSAIVLCASAARELSSETVARGRKQGLFTHQLTRALRGRDPRSLTWADVFPEVAAAVTRENLSQHPCRYGNGPIFAPGEIDPDDVDPPEVIELKKYAVVIGIDYQGRETEGGFAPLRTPGSDALEVARVLEEVQGYEIVGLSARRPGPLLNAKATRRRIHKILDRLVKVKAKTRRETSVVIYFAGHGVVRSGDDGQHAGYLVPWDAEAEDPRTWLAMKDLRDQLVDGVRDAERLDRLEQKAPLERLTSRHLLLVLDCCFGGALSFDFFRSGAVPDRPIYYSEYRRFMEGSAWQLLTSASHHQQAMDRDPADPADPHSPFARAFLEGLTTEQADASHVGGRSDHIVTAGELHHYIDARLKRMGVDVQTPNLMPLRPLQGQFFFHVPGFRPTPLPDPPLDPEDNPWRGARAYDREHADLFYGREKATLELLERYLEMPSASKAVLAVGGPSGSGKTSLVRAGLVPLLEDPASRRRGLRAWARRSGFESLSISREDLRAVRDWAERQELDGRLDRPEELADAVRRWAQRAGLLGAEPAAIEAQAQRESLGVPSFAEGDGEESETAWFRKLGMGALLSAPDQLALCLRRWLTRGGLIDFLSVPERALPGLVGRWSITDPEEARRYDDPQTRVLTALGPNAVDPDPSWDVYVVPRPTEDELHDIVAGPATARVLLFEPPELAERLVAEVASTPSPLPLLSAALAHGYEKAWERRQQKSRRQDQDRRLLAADFEPGALDLLGERAERVWRRLVLEAPELRRTLRSLLWRTVALDDGSPRSRPVTWRELDYEQPEERRRLHTVVVPALVRERVLVRDASHVVLAAPGLIDAWPRLRRTARLLRRRYPDVHGVWRRALEWEESDFDRGKLWPHDPIVRKLLHQPALSRLERAFLVASDMERRTAAVVRLATRAMPELSVEWSRGAALAARAGELALENERVAEELLARPSFGQAGSGPLAVGASLARFTRDLTRSIAEQTLHDVLATTSFSRPLVIPEDLRDSKILGLAFRGQDELRIRVSAAGISSDRVSSDRVSSDRVLADRVSADRVSADRVSADRVSADRVSADRVSADRVSADRVSADRVLAWDLRDLAQAPAWLPPEEKPKPGEGEVRPKPHPIFADEEIFPSVGPGPGPGPRAQAGYDRVVRYFPPQLLRIPVELGRFLTPPTPLRGHRAVPTFLAFSRFGRWLASAANLPTGPEIRLWPTKDLEGTASHPLSYPNEDLESFLEKTEGFDVKKSGVTHAQAPWEATGELDGTVYLRRIPKDTDPPIEPFGRFGKSADSALRAEDGAQPNPKLFGLVGSSADPGLRAEDGAQPNPKGAKRLSTARRPSGRDPQSFRQARTDPPKKSILLRPKEQEGFAVRALAFDRAGHRLAVERRALYDRRRRRVDVYLLDLEDLVRLVQNHAAYKLRQEDLSGI